MTDGSELGAHKFVIRARYSGFFKLFDLLKRWVLELYPTGRGLPDVRVHLDDINLSTLEVLVLLAYTTRHQGSTCTRQM